VPGYNTFTTNAIRNWTATFAQNDLPQPLEVIKSSDVKQAHELTATLYPSKRLKNTEQRELYIKQRYFYTAASLKDIVRRFKKRGEVKIQATEPKSVLLQRTPVTAGSPQAGTEFHFKSPPVDNVDKFDFFNFPNKVCI
jgi:glucan phosphorylase